MAYHHAYMAFTSSDALSPVIQLIQAVRLQHRAERGQAPGSSSHDANVVVHGTRGETTSKEALSDFKSKLPPTPAPHINIVHITYVILHYTTLCYILSYYIMLCHIRRYLRSYTYIYIKCSSCLLSYSLSKDLVVLCESDLGRLLLQELVLFAPPKRRTLRTSTLLIPS